MPRYFRLLAIGVFAVLGASKYGRAEHSSALEAAFQAMQGQFVLGPAAARRGERQAATQAADASAIPVRAAGKTFAAEMKTLHPLCDHFPCIGCSDSESPQHLYATVRIENTSSDELPPVKLEQTFVSFDPAVQGDQVEGFAFSDERPAPAPITAGGSAEYELTGDGLFPEDKHGQRLYLTLVLSIGAERLTIRGSEFVYRAD